MNTQRNRFIRWQMKRCKRHCIVYSYGEALHIWVCRKLLGEML